MPEDIDITNYSIPHWVLSNGMVNEKGLPLEFEDRLFLFDILTDSSPVIAVKKCAQVGVTVTLDLKAFFCVDKGGLNAIYTLPSDTDVTEFVNTKADMIHRNNECLRSRIRNDTVGIKQIGDRFLYYKGTRSRTAPLATSADLLIHDEIDRSDLKIVEMYRSRLAASEYGYIWYISNPSLVGVGIDEVWKTSDQKEWFITCSGCGTKQTLTWERNVDEIKKIYVCSHCNKELTREERRKGIWIAQKPENEVSGYHISQLMAPWRTAVDLIKEKENHSAEYFRNFVLGEPYSAGAESNVRQAIIDVWTADPLDEKPYYMGIDIGKIKHWILGSKRGIFRIGTCESREELETIIDKYNPHWVMDAGPERAWAEEFKKKYPRGFLNFYHRDREAKEIIRYGGTKTKNAVEDAKNWGYVWTDRNRAIDLVLYEIMKGNIDFSLMREDLEMYIKHWEGMRRLIEQTPQMTERYVWETATGLDHFVHATVFYYIARLRGGKGIEFVQEPEKSTSIIERTDEGFKMKSLEELFDEGFFQRGGDE